MTKGAKAIKYLEIEDIAAIISLLRNAPAEFGEDMPPFERVDLGKLSSCLAEARQVVFGQAVHPTLTDKAVWYFYSIIKNHPLANGNKRVAVFALIEFLRRNHKLVIDSGMTQDKLFDMAVSRAISDPSQSKETQHKLKKALRSLLAN
jgi:death-on-curing family protein